MTEYEGQMRVKYGNDIYSIYRSYVRDDGRIELYTEKRVGDWYDTCGSKYDAEKH